MACEAWLNKAITCNQEHSHHSSTEPTGIRKPASRQPRALASGKGLREASGLSTQVLANTCSPQGPPYQAGPPHRWVRGRGTYIQNVHALPEAVVEGVELRGQVLRHLARPARGGVGHTPRGGGPTQTPPRGATSDASGHLTWAGSVTVTATRALWRRPSNPATLFFSSRCRSTLASSTLTCARPGALCLGLPWGPHSAPPALQHLPVPAEARPRGHRTAKTHTGQTRVPAGARPESPPRPLLTSRAAAGLLKTSPSRARSAASQRSPSSDTVRAAQNPHGPPSVLSPKHVQGGAGGRGLGRSRGGCTPGLGQGCAQGSPQGKRPTFHAVPDIYGRLAVPQLLVP